MNRPIVIVGAVAACTILASLVYVQIGANTPAQSTPKTIEIGGQTIHVTIADTESSREQGLSGRASLAADEGMLFVFQEDGSYAFWMKDMLFSIDIVWFKADGTIVDIVSAASPASYPAAFVPRGTARYVVELPAGFTHDHNVKIGDIVRL